MNHVVCVFSDESGVFSIKKNRFFVLGGLILDTAHDEVGLVSRIYSAMETGLRKKAQYKNLEELKATALAPQDRRSIFSRLKPFRKFGVVIDLANVNPVVFSNKKSCQRYQDYSYVTGLRKAFISMMASRQLDYEEEIAFHFITDQHHTATDGEYELREMLVQLFKEGRFNEDFSIYSKPLFKNTTKVSLVLADSKKSILVRAADIIANRLYFEANKGSLPSLEDSNMVITRLP